MDNVEDFSKRKAQMKQKSIPDANRKDAEIVQFQAAAHEAPEIPPIHQGEKLDARALLGALGANSVHDGKRREEGRGKTRHTEASEN